MNKVTLGKTGIEVSPLCFGSLTVGPVQANLTVEDGGKVLAYAIENGINFFDTAELYETYEYIKKAMEINHNYDIVVSSKTYSYTEEMAVTAVEDARKRLDRDYIDIFMLHEQESVYTLEGHKPALEKLFEYKQKGIIKAVGLSTHHVAGVEGAIIKELDVIHPLINYKGLGIVDGSRSDMETSIKKAHDNGIGIFSMKALGGGNLFKEADKCLEYITNLSCVDSVAIGMQSIEEVDANIKFFKSGKFSDNDIDSLKNKTRKLHIDDWCTRCGNCVARCGQKALYLGEITAQCNHEKCILCGYCSTVCPMWAIKVV